MKNVFLILIILQFIGCNNKKLRSVVLDRDTRAVGDISSDTTYNGVIKFYNIKTNTIQSQYSYLNNELHGPATVYYKNGIAAAKFSYNHGKINGFDYQYDSFGNLKMTRNYYYGILCGPTITYDGKNPIKYSFYSFDNKPLMELDYGLLKNHSISDFVKEYFFFYKRDHQQLLNGVFTNIDQQYFLYMPGPPGYQFRYTLVNVDSKMKILDTIKKFQQVVFDTFNLSTPTDSLSHVAICLQISDPNKGEGTLLKLLR